MAISCSGGKRSRSECLLAIQYLISEPHRYFRPHHHAVDLQRASESVRSLPGFYPEIRSTPRPPPRAQTAPANTISSQVVLVSFSLLVPSPTFNFGRHPGPPSSPDPTTSTMMHDDPEKDAELSDDSAPRKRSYYLDTDPREPRAPGVHVRGAGAGWARDRVPSRPRERARSRNARGRLRVNPGEKRQTFVGTGRGAARRSPSSRSSFSSFRCAPFRRRTRPILAAPRRRSRT